MNIKEEFGGIFANSCIVIGECEKNLSLMDRNRISKLNLEINNIKYDIEISEIIFQKKIIVKAEPKANFCDILKIVTEILRFENIFEGYFYQLKSYEVSEIEYIQKIKKYLLSYFESSYNNFCSFPFQYSDKDYRRLFLKWENRQKNWGIIHPMFLYATYTKGITTDIKMALLLEVFEPIAEQLHDEEKITLIKSPYLIFSETCSQCGNIVKKQVPNKSLHFADKLKAVIVNFGGDIFEKENIEKLVKYSVNVRNKIDHVKMENEECMSGEQCGFYLHKFCLLYRYIILKELQGNESETVPVIVSYRKELDRKYPKCIIK